MVVLIALGSLGCGPTEEAYLAKVNEAETYERLSQQRQTEIMEKEKELETTMGHLGEAEAQAGKLYQELAKTEAQLEITMDRLRKAETQTGRLYEELAKTEAQLETTIGRLEKAETQTGRPAEEFAQKEARLRETNVQLEKVSIINQKHEENIKDFFLQIVNLEQKEQELQEKYKTLKEHEKDLKDQVMRYQMALLEKEAISKSLPPRQQELIESLRHQLESDKIKIMELSNRITVRLDERLLFDSGKAFVKASGFKVLRKIGMVLKKIHDRHIQVEGHTDNHPIGNRLKQKYATNWELSVARATTVTRYLVEVIKIAPQRISAAGFGEFQPIADNKTPEGRHANRRVEFALFPLRPHLAE